jgi:hypothetical protein
MGKATVSNTICHWLALWQGSRFVKPVNITLSVMSLADVASTLFKFYRAWRGV